jgi:phenylalanyl-tRNA synthetase beta subunit
VLLIALPQFGTLRWLCQALSATAADSATPNRHDALRALSPSLGIDVADNAMVPPGELGGAETAGTHTCTIPYQRIDLEREIDLIEEVGRIVGLEQIHIADSLRIRVAPPQPTELARRAVSDALVGMGYIETVTHSLVSDQAAAAFLPSGMDLLRVADERAKAEPALRPSILPSLCA